MKSSGKTAALIVGGSSGMGKETTRRLRTQGLDLCPVARDRGVEAGCENPAQFSREYKRTFGLSPKRDIAKILRTLSTGFAPASTQGS